MVKHFNDLLVDAGISPANVRLLRHHTKPGLNGQSLHELWQRDRPGFELYQRVQASGRRLFRTGGYWASFVSPSPGSAMFVGLYEATFEDTRVVAWSCPFRGDIPGGGEPVDVFEAKLRPELSGLIGKLHVEWDPASVRSWARYAEDANFAIVGDVPPPDFDPDLAGDTLVDELVALGFNSAHATKKVVRLERGSLVVYVKRDTALQPLVVHPRYLDLAGSIAALGVDFAFPARPYINSNLGEFPLYEAQHRQTPSRFGFALAPTKRRLAALVDFLEHGATIDTANGPVRVFGTSKNPLTERERLAAARVGQGDFRNALLAAWDSRCPIANVDQVELLRASHIKPWAKSNDRERLDPYNGLLLCAHVDAMFDRGLISFTDDGRLLVSRRLDPVNLGRLGLNGTEKLALDPRHVPYLDHHRRHVFVA